MHSIDLSRYSPQQARNEILTFDDWVRTLPGLPNFDFASDDETSDVEDPGFKVYETLSDLQRSVHGSVCVRDYVSLGDNSIFYHNNLKSSRTQFQEDSISHVVYSILDNQGIVPTSSEAIAALSAVKNFNTNIMTETADTGDIHDTHQVKSMIDISCIRRKPFGSRTSLPLPSISNLIKCMSETKCEEHKILLNVTEDENSDDEVFLAD